MPTAKPNHIRCPTPEGVLTGTLSVLGDVEVMVTIPWPPCLEGVEIDLERARALWVANCGSGASSH